jgi:hypothetical protein
VSPVGSKKSGAVYFGDINIGGVSVTLDSNGAEVDAQAIADIAADKLVDSIQQAVITLSGGNKFKLLQG